MSAALRLTDLVTGISVKCETVDPVSKDVGAFIQFEALVANKQTLLLLPRLTVDLTCLLSCLTVSLLRCYLTEILAIS